MGQARLRTLEDSLAAKMKRSLDGDAAAYRELLNEVRDVLMEYFSHHLQRCRVGDTAFAEDLVQETLLGIHEKRVTYDPGQPFTPWMYAIARYKLIDLLRRRKNLRLHDEIDSIDEIASVLPDGDGTAGHDVNTLLKELPEKHRQLIELTKIEGLSIAEVSARTGMSKSAVKVTIHRAIQALRKKLQESSNRGSP